MSTPWWRRPPERANPQESMNWTGPPTGHWGTAGGGGAGAVVEVVEVVGAAVVVGRSSTSSPTGVGVPADWAPRVAGSARRWGAAAVGAPRRFGEPSACATASPAAPTPSRRRFFIVPKPYDRTVSNMTFV